jgi:hypothetical protein
LVGYPSGWDGAGVSASFVNGVPASERPRRLLMDGSRTLAGAGWGRSSIEYDPDAKSVVWEFPNGTAIGLAAKLEGKRTNPACAFISGVVAGWTNRSLGIEAEFEEMECVARGDGRCRFTATEFGRLPV